MDIEINFNEIRNGDFIVTENHKVYKYIGYFHRIRAYIAVAIDDSDCMIFDRDGVSEFEKIYRRTVDDVNETSSRDNVNNKSDNVEHPSHYTSHPSGVECITVARHFCFDIGNAIKYLWRAGLKKEQGMSNLEKEIEDCNKAIWYIKDHVKMLNKKLNKNEENNSVSGHYKHDFL